MPGWTAKTTRRADSFNLNTARRGGYDGRKDIMAERKFELFMCCLGNGITICNKAVYENHDYKMIGHISAAGNVSLYVKPDYIPPEDMERIKSAAARARNDFINWLDMEIKYRPLVIFGRMLDALNTTEYLTFQKTHRDEEIASQIGAIVPLYLERS